MNKESPIVSIVVPVFNEAESLTPFHSSLTKVLDDIHMSYEIIYCDDGSQDESAQIISQWHTTDRHVKLLKLSRNFGKEYALTAGLTAATGQAILMIDSDGQHPVELIPEFIKQWRDGAQVVIGIRDNTVATGSKQFASNVFYKVFNIFASQRLEPNSTDFRLLDAEVRRAFLQLPETNRLTRGLIDWLGFRRSFIHFNAQARKGGDAVYNNGRLARLAADSLVSLSPKPLYVFGCVGVFITIVSFLLGSVVFIEQILAGDPLNWNFTGTAMLAIIIVFLVGIVLMSQAILSLYVSNIQAQVKRRPLYIIDTNNSLGLPKDKTK